MNETPDYNEQHDTDIDDAGSGLNSGLNVHFPGLLTFADIRRQTHITKSGSSQAADNTENASAIKTTKSEVTADAADDGTGMVVDDSTDETSSPVEEADTATSASTEPATADSEAPAQQSDTTSPLASIRNTIRQARARAATVIASKPVQYMLTALKAIYRLWRKRPKCPYTLYVVVMALMDAAAVIFIQWGMYSEPEYDDPSTVDETTKIMNSVNGQLTKFVSQMWLEPGKLNWLLNFCALGMIYLVLVFVLNRFWVATAIFAIVMSSFAVANSIKVQLRNEPVIPSDLSFLSSGNGGEITSFVPKGSQALVNGTITMLIWLTVICLIIQFVDGRRCVIPFHWWRPFRNVKTVVGNLTRIVAVATSVALLWSFTWNLGVNGSWSYNWAKSMGDGPIPWSTVTDATNNGPAMNFLRLARAKTMEKPEGYNKETMAELAKRYAKNAQITNQSRTNNLTDSTVIMILSESFSDPTRVPGVALTEDPMPNIRGIKDSTTSGLMLSPAIGGGTANIEHQALTGLSLALFDDSMQSPYQELVPHQKNPFTFNQIWNTKYGKTGSVAFHPFNKNMYLRDANYKKFGFSHFYTLDSKPAINHQDHIDGSPYVSDAAAYQNVIDAVNAENSHPQFIQLVTMQNHAPYDDYYTNNQFREADVSNLSDDEKWTIDSYTKGVNLTDQATADFLNQLNTINKPITVIFYGDHLPGVYSTATADKNNTIPLHETDYFIWSNQASSAAGTKLDTNTTGFVSSNYFMSLAAAHMNAKVSPYLELLSEAHTTVPAISRLVGSNGSWGDGGTAYLDASGNRITHKNLSKEAQKLLKDYRLVQYDMTKGKGYLQNNFFAVK